MSWISLKKKRGFFVPFILSEGIFFGICFISMYNVLNTLSEYTYFYISKKNTLFYLFLKSSKAFCVSLNVTCMFSVCNRQN